MSCTADTPCITLNVSPSPSILTAAVVKAPKSGDTLDNGIECTATGLYCPAPQFQSGGSPLGAGIDGEIKYYEASASAGYVWGFRYRASSASPYKWECIGGTPTHMAAYSTGVFLSPSGTIHTLGTMPALLAGDYDVVAQMNVALNGAANDDVAIELWARVGAESEPPFAGTALAHEGLGGAISPTGAAVQQTVYYRTTRNVAAAGTTISLRAVASYSSGGSTPAAIGSDLWLMPIRCA